MFQCSAKTTPVLLLRGGHSKTGPNIVTVNSKKYLVRKYVVYLVGFCVYTVGPVYYEHKTTFLGRLSRG